MHNEPSNRQSIERVSTANYWALINAGRYADAGGILEEHPELHSELTRQVMMGFGATGLAEVFNARCEDDNH